MRRQFLRAVVRMATSSNGVSSSAEASTASGSSPSAETSTTSGSFFTTTPESLNLSFCGCGFLGLYHLGVCHCLREHGQRMLKNVKRYGGASAGSLVAAVMAIDPGKIEECIEFTYDLAAATDKKIFGTMTPKHSLLGPLEEFLRTALPADAHKMATGRLYVSVTNVDTKKNELISEFDTKDELIQCLLGSSCIPYVTESGKKPGLVKDKKYYDGGMTDNLPVFEDGRMIFVSPFCGRQHICPLDKTGRGLYVTHQNQDFQVNVANLIRGYHALAPPKKDQMSLYYKHGFKDAERFLKNEGFHEPKKNVERIVIYETTL